MRITQYRTLRTWQDWGRSVGDANGVHADGIVDVELVLVDTDEGITGVGMGPGVALDRVFAAIEGEDPRATVALYDRMLRYAFKAVTPVSCSGRSERSTAPCGTSRPRRRGSRSGACWADGIGRFRPMRRHSTSRCRRRSSRPPTG